MNQLVLYVIVFAILFGMEELYFYLAKRYRILDRPNHRTLHEKPTIRGGGVIFPVSVLVSFLLFGLTNYFFLGSLVLVAMVSFIDDLGHVKSIIRFSAQFLAIALAMYSIGYFDLGGVLFMLILIIAVGAMNAYNFMDGINGITVGYSLVALISLYYVNEKFQAFASENLLVCIGLGLIVFSYYNFRTKARCFSGDVGSISIAFILIYLLLDLIHSTDNFSYVLFLAVYGVDSVLTIVHRLINRENIFEAHKSHLFQILVYKAKLKHLQVTGIYMVVQLLINIALLNLHSYSFTFQFFLSTIILIILAIIYVYLKFKYLKMA